MPEQPFFVPGICKYIVSLSFSPKTHCISLGTPKILEWEDYFSPVFLPYSSFPFCMKNAPSKPLANAWIGASQRCDISISSRAGNVEKG